MTQLRLYDNTRLSDFKRCPRYYFFRHVNAWARPAPSIPLIFGGAWHEAMDAVWLAIKNGQSDQGAVQEGFAAFVAHWEDNGLPPVEEMDISTQADYKPRTPGTAMEMLYAYVDERRRAIEQSELIKVERPFAVPLDPEDPTLFYNGRIDKITRRDRTLRGIEHKTTTATKKDGTKYKIRPLFMESFSPNSQVDGYLFALRMLYPDEPRIDVWVDAALVHAEGEDFKFIPVDRNKQQLDGWLGEVHYWVSQVEMQLALLAVCRDSDVYMAAFPKNTNSCFDFNTACPYLPLCKSRANPLTWGEDPPQDYITKVWDPLEHAGTPEELK